MTDDLISREEAYRVLTEYYHHQTETQHKALREALDRVPAVDAVPVIRCRDCKYAKKIYIKNLPWLKQWEYSCRYLNTESVAGDGFCSYAERKESEHD